MNVSTMISKRDKALTALPSRWPWLFRGFRKYARKYAAKHLHAVRVVKCALPPRLWHGPAIMVMNHPSWWDPIIAFILSGLWPDRLDFAPIDAKALRQYRFSLAKIGLFGIEQESARGAREFLGIGRTIMANDHATMWITAQGEFTDCRLRPVQLRGGVGHLAAGMDHGVVIPAAVEYPFWNERTPEALIAFGHVISIADHPDLDAASWTLHIAAALEAAQDNLATEAQSRDPMRFDTLVSGRAGVGGVYDLGRQMRSWLTGQRFRAEHSHSFADE